MSFTQDKKDLSEKLGEKADQQPRDPQTGQFVSQGEGGRQEVDRSRGKEETGQQQRYEGSSKSEKFGEKAHQQPRDEQGQFVSQ